MLTKNDLLEIRNIIIDSEKRINSKMDTEFSRIDSKFIKIDSRFNKIDSEFGKVWKAITNMDNRLSKEILLLRKDFNDHRKDNKLEHKKIMKDVRYNRKTLDLTISLFDIQITKLRNKAPAF